MPVLLLRRKRSHLDLRGLNVCQFYAAVIPRYFVDPHRQSKTHLIHALQEREGDLLREVYILREEHVSNSVMVDLLRLVLTSIIFYLQMSEGRMEVMRVIAVIESAVVALQVVRTKFS